MLDTYRRAEGYGSGKLSVSEIPIHRGCPTTGVMRLDTYVGPLGLGRGLSLGYKHVAPLGLNEPMHRLPFSVPFSIL